MKCKIKAIKQTSKYLKFIDAYLNQTTLTIETPYGLKEVTVNKESIDEQVGYYYDTQIIKVATRFVNRLAKIGIKVELMGNLPWIYLDRVNGNKVEGTRGADHGWLLCYLDGKSLIGRREVFEKVRELL